MKYKAIFLDIDDTLLSHNQPVSARNLEAIARAQAAGVLVTIATGRGYLGCTAVWKQLGLQGPIIVFGGALIMDTRDGKTIFSAEVPPALVRESLEYARELGLVAQIYQGDTVIVEEDNPTSKAYVGVQNLPYLVDPDIRRKEWKEIPKVLVFSPLDVEPQMVQKFEERFTGRLEVASSKPGFIELNLYGSNKGTTMLRLAEQLGIRQEEIIAVGDNTLDLQMIQMAGLGVCVENGQQVVKDVADAVAPACEADGVAWVIDTYIFGQ